MKTVIITGVARGLGLALTSKFLNSNWDVFALDKNPAIFDDEKSIFRIEFKRFVIWAHRYKNGPRDTAAVAERIYKIPNLKNPNKHSPVELSCFCYSALPGLSPVLQSA